MKQGFAFIVVSLLILCCDGQSVAAEPTRARERVTIKVNEPVAEPTQSSAGGGGGSYGGGGNYNQGATPEPPSGPPAILALNGQCVAHLFSP